MALNGFLTELRRRRVFRVGGVYLVIGWVAIQAAATSAPLLLLPAWIPRAVALIAIVGFPIALHSPGPSR
jgi:hypothetical protein